MESLHEYPENVPCGENCVRTSNRTISGEDMYLGSVGSGFYVSRFKKLNLQAALSHYTQIILRVTSKETWSIVFSSVVICIAPSVSGSLSTF